MLIRDASVADATAIAQVHVEVWRSAYQGIIPQSHLDQLSVAQREENWRKRLQAAPAQLHAVVAVENESVVGFSCGGPNRESLPPFDGEIYAIYLLAQFQKKGTGRQLFQASFDRLRQAGFQSAVVWVLEANPTCRFYEHCQGKCVGRKIEKIGGKELPEIAYGWTDLTMLQ